MSREPDVIDVRLTDEPLEIGMAAAWADLRALVLESSGVDLNGRHGFRVIVKPVASTGSRRMSAIICGPRGAHSPETLLAQSYFSLFGAMSPPMFDLAQTSAREGHRATFAASMASARTVENRLVG